MDNQRLLNLLQAIEYYIPDDKYELMAEIRFTEEKLRKEIANKSNKKETISDVIGRILKED